ncbi:MAG: aldolase/citrate lyase family protein [Candidatus Hinthialibacter antarcticus]|nr:aldolase/citrate lyase family protein [Candidatus Hinthialibacter antarcticus]
MQGNKIRESIRQGRRVYGIHISHAGSAYYAQKTLGLDVDFVFLDTEHVPVDRSDLHALCATYASHGASPAVRILHPDIHLATAALDAGAQGIVVPYIETVEEIAETAGVARFRPFKGQRLRNVVAGVEQLNEETERYLLHYNANNYFLIGIESVPAIENLDALLNVAGVDGVFIGPHDLSLSLELPEQYQHPRFVEAVLSIIERARRAGLGAGMHVKADTAPPPQLAQYIDAGLNWILYSHDVSIMVEAANQQLNQMRILHGDTFNSHFSPRDSSPEI